MRNFRFWRILALAPSTARPMENGQSVYARVLTPEADPARHARKTLQRGASLRGEDRRDVIFQACPANFALTALPSTLSIMRSPRRRPLPSDGSGERWKRRSPSCESSMPPIRARARRQQLRQARRALVTEAGHALWMLVVQREACGLRDSRTLMRDYDVPGEVQQCMGAGLATPTRDATMPY